jgi:uncharacterized protein (TIGR03000 family)
VVHVRGGETTDLAFQFDADAPQVVSTPTLTTLTLHVPSDARVSLAGNETASTGSMRQFTTSDLSSGEQWDDYRIVVTLERNGEQLTREKTLTIAGGDSRELSFDFTEASVALR